MKAILISIKPKYVAKILNGEKTIEIRKTMPKCDLPIDVYIYCTKGKPTLKGGYFDYEKLNGKVVAKFTLNKVEEIKFFEEFVYPNGYEDYDGEWVDTSEIYKNVHYINNGTLQKTCLSYEELQNYLGKKNGCAIHINDLEIFDKPKEISEIKHIVTKQNYFYGCKTYKEYFAKPLTKAPKNFCYVEINEDE